MVYVMLDFIALNVFTLLVFIGIFVGINNVKELSEKTKNKVVRNVSLILLSINIIKLVLVDGFIPVEFSTVSYYVVPIILLLRIKKLEIWAVYAGLMAGFFYYATMMIQGGVIYETYPPLNIHTSLLCHGSLLFLSIFKLKTSTFSIKERYKLVIGLVLMVGWAVYMRQFLIIEERLFIYELIDAKYIKAFTSNIIVLFGYYVVLMYLVLRTTKLVFNLNKKMNPNYDLSKIGSNIKEGFIKYTFQNSLGKTINLK